MERQDLSICRIKVKRKNLGKLFNTKRPFSHSDAVQQATGVALVRRMNFPQDTLVRLVQALR